MFNVGMMEFIALIVIAYVVVGPKDLPKVVKWLARAIRYLKELSRDVIASLNLEEELSTVKEITDVKKTIEEAIDPKQILAPVNKEFSAITNEINQTVQMGSKIKIIDK